MVNDTLGIALVRYFDNPLSELPDALKELVEEQYFPMQWDECSPEQRKTIASQIDNWRDPDYIKAFEAWSQFFDRKSGLESEIDKWNHVAVPSASDLEIREANLDRLKNELAILERQERASENGNFMHIAAASAAENKSLHKNTHNKMLKVILSMAMAKYGYKPDAESNTATGTNIGSIHADMDPSLKVGVDSIRKYLKQASDCFYEPSCSRR